MSPHDAVAVMQRLLKFVNGFFFLKKGYAFLSHIVPFGVASLLLLILSLPAENLLVKLEKILSSPDSLSIPALFLTAVTLTVYVFSVRTQIRRAYLDQGRYWLRTLVTAAVFIVLATLMAWHVLESALPMAGDTEQQAGIGRVWACLLVALLSLTGIGWTTPGTWHERVGVEMPDYRKAWGLISAIAAQLAEIRASRAGTPLQRDALKKAFDDLGGELRQNVRLEPPWARPPLDDAKAALQSVAERLEEDFASDPNVVDLPAAIRGNQNAKYPGFDAAFSKVANFFPGWKQVASPASVTGGAS